MKLRGGEEILITGAVELPPLRAFAEDIPLDVVYEDESIAVINKPAGMSVHAGSGKGEAGNRGTMVNALLHRFNRLSEIGGELRPGIVHRLDKETSGLVLVANLISLTESWQSNSPVARSKRRTSRWFTAGPK